MSGWGALALGFGALSLVSGLLQTWASDKEQDKLLDEKVEEKFNEYMNQKGEEDQ